jgi:cohesin loading factor subunit SCC2
MLVQAQPSILSTGQIEALLPYLHSAESAHERSVRDLLLRVFRATLPFLPPAALPTTERLQLDLTQLLNKVPPNQSTLQELVACLCDVVTKHTHQFGKLCSIFKAIDKALTEQLKLVKVLSLEIGDPSVQRSFSTGEEQKVYNEKRNRLAALERTSAALVVVFGLLAQYSDFDTMREEHEEAVESVNGLTVANVSDTAYNKLIILYGQPELVRLQTAILSSLGSLFKGFPTLMMRPESGAIMDAIFEDADRKDARSRLLFLMQDFLSTQAIKNKEDPTEVVRSKGTPSKRATPKKQQDGVDLNELIGNTDGFADSGCVRLRWLRRILTTFGRVSSAIVQRYLSHILVEATSTHAINRNAALEIISFTVRLGLAHPVQCLPTIVALEASADPAISKKAITLHASLHNKHAGLVSSKFLECATAAFQYCQDVAASRSDPRGYNQEDASALLSPWYSLLKEKRPIRLEFVKTLAKSLAVDASRACSAKDVAVARFIVDNLACLDFKTQEEIFIVLKQIDRILGDSGMQTMQMIGEHINKDAMELDQDHAKTGRRPRCVGFSSLPIERKLSKTSRSNRSSLLPSS